MLIVMIAWPAVAQKKKKFELDFYGFVRVDGFYNSRKNVESIEGIFSLYPMGPSYDADGKDLNAVPDAGIFAISTRLGLDVKGPDFLKAKTSAKVEADFAGYTAKTPKGFGNVRLRQAFVRFDWTKSALIVGQTWHPMWSVFPEMINLSTGAPFQPFNRSPQVQYNFTLDNVRFIGAALYQMQFASSGPDGKLKEYQKNNVLPELYGGVEYKYKEWTVGGGAEFKRIRPRTEATVGDKTYKVSEYNSSASFNVYGRFKKGDWAVAAKTVYGQNLSDMCMLGGYGVTSISSENGEAKYVNFNNSTSWLNIVWGKKYQVGTFLGYSKNLGTNKPLLNSKDVYGSGTNIDQLCSGSLYFAANISNFRMGVEYSYTNAGYGKNDLETGKVKDITNVGNNRVAATVIYNF